ncbi:hypothetical protein GCM10009860_04170 [Microbacterium mitrae]
MHEPPRVLHEQIRVWGQKYGVSRLFHDFARAEQGKDPAEHGSAGAGPVRARDGSDDGGTSTTSVLHEPPRVMHEQIRVWGQKCGVSRLFDDFARAEQGKARAEQGKARAEQGPDGGSGAAVALWRGGAANNPPRARQPKFGATQKPPTVWSRVFGVV